MITCPWCGTSHTAFQPNCQKCGGPLRPAAAHADKSTLKPPPAPRTIADKFVWSLMLIDAWAIIGAVFTILGGSFTILGLVLTIIIITAFVGIPFMILGILQLAGGLAILIPRHRRAQKIIDVLRHGESIDGQIVNMEKNMTVRVGLQRPWVIRYRFQISGQDYEGVVSTLNRPEWQPGQTVCVLYLPQSPEYNALYPHP